MRFDVSCQSAMSPHLDNFKRWFSSIVADLYNNEHAGFAILMIIIPVLERYLREKSGVHEERLDSGFYSELRGVFPTLSDNEMADEFWHVYRNGLLHQVTPSQQNWNGDPMPRAWVSRGDPQAIKVDQSGDFF